MYIMLLATGFFVYAFGGSMLRLARSQQPNTAGHKFYQVFLKIFPRKLGQAIDAKFAAPPSGSGWQYGAFVVIIVAGSWQITRKAFYNKIFKSKYNNVFIDQLSTFQKIFLYSLYVQQPLYYFIARLTPPDSVKIYADETLLNLPKRTHHCRICGKTRVKFDHHCAWIGNCVAGGNQLAFAWFLLATIIIQLTHAFYNIMFIQFALRQVNQKSPSTYLFNYYTPVLAQTLAFLLIGFALMGFAYQQLRNIMKNQTTFERLKLKRLINEVRTGKKFITQKENCEYNVITKEKDQSSYESCDKLNKNEALKILNNRNIYNRGCIHNLAESFQLALSSLSAARQNRLPTSQRPENEKRGPL